MFSRHFYDSFLFLLFWHTELKHKSLQLHSARLTFAALLQNCSNMHVLAESRFDPSGGLAFSKKSG